MSETQAASSAVTPEVLVKLWQGFLYQSVAFAAAVLFGTLYLEFEPARPEWQPYVLVLAIAALAAGMLLLQRHRGWLRQVRRDQPDRLQQLRERMTLGMAVADLPAIAGVLYYIATGNGFALMLLLASTCLLVYLYKPDV